LSEQKIRPLEVAIDSWASTDDQQAVDAIFEECGIDVSMRVIIRKADIQLPWEVMITAGPLGAGFLAAIGKNAGDDVYRQAKQLVSRLWRSRNQHTGRDGHIVLRDDDFRVELLLQENLPVEAYQAIERIDRSMVERGDTLHYDRDENAWLPYGRESGIRI
jgi:hypothetical protein